MTKQLYPGQNYQWLGTPTSGFYDGYPHTCVSIQSGLIPIQGDTYYPMGLQWATFDETEGSILLNMAFLNWIPNGLPFGAGS